jgi:hypothetical protein
MRSPRGLAGSIVVIAGIVFGLGAGIVFNAGATEILHVALGIGFLLFAIAVFDFRLPRVINWIACIGIGALALIFLLQGVAEISKSAELAQLAYGILGQRLEKALGYLFLGWCLAVVLRDSAGGTRALGIAALLVVMAVEIYGSIGAMTGLPVNEALKLLYVPVFVWLALESRKAREFTPA